MMNNNVVYKINCVDCEASYVGQTKRLLKNRIKEHMYNIKSDPSKYTIISEDMVNHDHTFDWDNIRILDFEPNYHKRLISEMIHIKEQKMGINSKKDTELLYDSYSDILDILSNR